MKNRKSREVVAEIEYEDGELVITIPRSILRALGVKAGDKVEVEADNTHEGFMVRKHLAN